MNNKIQEVDLTKLPDADLIGRRVKFVKPDATEAYGRIETVQGDPRTVSVTPEVPSAEDSQYAHGLRWLDLYEIEDADDS